MKAQNSDSFSPEVTSALPEVSKTPSINTKEHKGPLDILGAFWHKKLPEKPTGKEVTPSVVASQQTVSAPLESGEAVIQSGAPLIVPEKSHISVTEKISHIFHKKTSELTKDQGAEILEKKDPLSVSEKNEPESVFVADEKFDRLLKQDITYHSMIRSEDLKNIQLQLSMRYMLLILAIFVVIAWVVNNRVIMFGFSDFPLLARSRDALFALLTGLFSLTVWFGSAVWFRHYIGVIILRIVGCVLLVSVLVSIYFPFWR